MFKKLKGLSTRAYTRVYSRAYCAAQDLKRLGTDESGLSGVVVAVLLILVAVLAIVLLWSGLKDWLTTTWGNITSKAGEIS